MNPEQINQNTSNLTREELDTFLRLPIDQQEKEKDDRLVHLKSLNDQLDLAIQEGLKTGKPEEAQRLLEELRQGVQDLGQEIEATEKPEFPFKYEKLIKVKTRPDFNSVTDWVYGCDIGEHINFQFASNVLNTTDLLKRTTFSSEQKEYNLVIISVEDFGLSGRVSKELVYEKAKEIGLEICPAEVGPLLRLKYDDQPTDRSVYIAMESLYNSHNVPSSYVLRHESLEIAELSTMVDDGDFEWSDQDLFCFQYDVKNI